MRAEWGHICKRVNELERRSGVEKEGGGFSKNLGRGAGGIEIFIVPSAIFWSTICSDNNDEKLNFENGESTLLEKKLRDCPKFTGYPGRVLGNFTVEKNY